MKINCFYLILPLILILSPIFSINLRISNDKHTQLTTFADIINNSNHVDDSATSSSSAQPSKEQTLKKSSPRVTISVIIPIICLFLFCTFCVFCFKCVKNEQDQAEQSLQQTIPCFCGPIKWICKCCKYLVIGDVILRCLGFRSTNWQKQEKKRSEEEAQRKMSEDQYKLNLEKMNSNNLPNYPLNLQSNEIWKTSNDPQISQKLKKLKCNLCHKKNSKIVANCSSQCVFHLPCLISYKTESSASKKSKICPNCSSDYQNLVKFYCQKCFKKYAQILLERNASEKDFIKSIGGQKCTQCARKKWFWQ